MRRSNSEPTQGWETADQQATEQMPTRRTAAPRRTGVEPVAPRTTGRHTRITATPPGESGKLPTLVSGIHPRPTRVIAAIAPNEIASPTPGHLPSQLQISRSEDVMSGEDSEIAVTRVVTRVTASARPVRPEDTALVERTTRIIRAVELAREPVAPALAESETPIAPVTLVPGSGKIPVIHPVRRRPRPWTSHLSMYLLTVVVVLGVLVVAAPVAITRVESHPFVLQALLHASQPTSTAHEPAGPWDTSSGVADTLGLGGGAAPGVQAPGSAGLAVKTVAPPAPAAPPPAPPAASNSGVLAAPLQPWPPSDAFMAVPGHPAFGMNDPNGYYYWAFGQCTWWAQYKRQDENLTHMGNAMYWAGSAAGRGLSVGNSPAAGATVVFQPGVQGAGGAGHVAHVEAVYPDGWFLVSEMNFYVNGGGWGRVDYRYAHTGWGVQFIY